MKRYFLLGMTSVLLHGEFVTEGKFFAQIAEVFSITLSANTLSADLGVLGTAGIMGSFTATLTDTTVPPPDGDNYVRMFSVITDADDNSQIQMIRVTNLGSTPPDPTPEPRIDLSIYDDLDASGNPVGGDGRLIDNNVSIRTRTRDVGNTYTNEVHTLTVHNASFNSSLQGNYRTTLYFQLETP
ncbi:hypothetical protein K0U07_05475 [bacterium]|nr:hypothetical protein [bacterium]